MFFETAIHIIPQDSNLLFSTVAQSTAALVAIVGAFVLTESIKARSQVFELKLRDMDLILEKEVKEWERNLARSTLLISNSKRFFKHHLGEYLKLEKQNSINFEKMWAEYQPPDLEPSDKVKIRRNLEEIVTKFYNKAAINPSDKNAPDESVGPDQDYYLLELYVEKRLTNPKAKDDETDAEDLGSTSYEAREMRVNRVKRAQELDTKLKSIEKSISGNKLQIAQIESSMDLQRAISILAIFGTVGMIYPIALMTRSLSYREGFWRYSVLIFFSVGFLSMLAFFWNLIATARREPELPKP